MHALAYLQASVIMVLDLLDRRVYDEVVVRPFDTK